MLTAKEAKEISVHNKTLVVVLKKVSALVLKASKDGREYTQFSSDALDSLNVKTLVCAKLKQLGYKTYSGNSNTNKIDIYWEHV